MEKEIMIKDLRSLLFEISDQKMTIEELRRNLFEEEDQEFFLNENTKRKLGLFIS